ncbi:PucR family transcriptional regulator [Nocardia blacklockiae]|uniref:PucR family transcriptional regulator n=1 Tax=Nocardia blacklockiae TaxID=480036 RepID=UPI001893EC9D|nr:helix-turn-helix domain-containing protein [Nocardia blacklockiae]MBF6175927.1 PucR family transcriptional regulator [Nocardia blacklockiae]
MADAFGADARYWEPPSERTVELLRAAVELVLDHPELMYEAMDDASLAAASPAIAAEPALAEAVRACVRANLTHWCLANLSNPGMPVAPNLSAENVNIARAVVRHGFDEMLVTNFHAGQNAAVRKWTQLAFFVSPDPYEVRELLDVVMGSIFAFIDDTLAGVFELIQRERRELADVDHTERMETLNLVLGGAPISAGRAGERLRYELDRSHLAAIVWSDSYPAEPEPLEKAVNALAQAAGSVQPLTLVPSPSTLWVWLPAERLPELEPVRAALTAPGVRMAVGSVGTGMAGFRRAHLDAVAAQRLMRRLPAGARLATYDEVEVVALATGDEERAREFVTRTLGNLVTADAELRETVRVYLHEGSNTTRTARALFTHRNTIVHRLDRVRGLLPCPLEQRPLQVALALEIVRVIGAADGH